jgi:hypothetical protein
VPVPAVGFPVGTVVLNWNVVSTTSLSITTALLPNDMSANDPCATLSSGWTLRYGSSTNAENLSVPNSLYTLRSW